MNVDTMRNVDYWAGVPLCFVATYAKKVLDAINKKPTPDVPKKVLLVELSEMGSAILVDPAMEELKRRGCELYFLIFKKNKISLKLLNTVDEENIFTIDADSFSSVVKDTLSFLKWSREKEIDTVIDLELFSRFTALLCGYSGAKNIVGFYRFHNEGLYRGEMLTHKVAYNPHIHITKNFYSLIDSLFSKDYEVPYSKKVIDDSEISLKKAEITEESKEVVWKKIEAKYSDAKSKRVVLVNANASDLLPLRRWDKFNYCEVIKNIIATHEDVLILLTGAPAEAKGLERIVECVKSERCINFAGCVEFMELLPLYEISEFMLTNDSGPAHFASVTSMPTFVIFGPETPDLYGSLGETTPIYSGMNCSPCVSAWNHRKSACTDNRCIQVITPEHVLSVLESSLKSSRFAR